MRGKLITLYLLIVAISLFAIYWKMDRDFFGEKMASNETQSRSQLASLTRATEAELEGLTQVLDLAMPILSGSKKDTYSSDQAFGRFHLIARFSGTGTDLHLDSIFNLEKSPVRSWGATYATAALRSGWSRQPEVDASTAHLWTLLDPERHVWFLYEAISPVTQEHYVAILPNDFLQGLLDRQKGQASVFAIVNEQAQVLAHTTSEYIGQLLSQDPLVQMIQNSGHPTGSGLFDGLQGERVQGLFEKVNGANLFVTISTPVRLLLAERSHLKSRFLFLGLGLSLIGVCLILLLPDQSEAPLSPILVVKPAAAMPIAKAQSLPEAPRSPLPPAPPSVAVVDLIKAPHLVPQVEKFEALFNDTKVAGAMELIDTLDEGPPPASSVSTTPLRRAEENIEFPPPPAMPAASPAGSVQVQAAPPPPPWAGQHKPQIEIPRPAHKLDDFAVKIRKPRTGPANEAT